MQLEGKRCLITGAGSGIGRAMALEAAKRGLKLILVGRRTEMLRKTSAQIADPDQTVTIAADITNTLERRRLVSEISDRFSCLDILINNAGQVAVGRFESLNDHDIESMVAVNLVAPMALSRDFLPLLKNSSAARIVNVGSVFGDIAYPYFAAYSATKFGLRGLSDALRRELSSAGIAVTYLAPRATHTPAATQFASLVEPLQMNMDTPERVAVQCWDAIAAGKREAFPRGMESLFVRVQRWFPKLIDANIIRQISSDSVQKALDISDIS